MERHDMNFRLPRRGIWLCALSMAAAPPSFGHGQTAAPKQNSVTDLPANALVAKPTHPVRHHARRGSHARHHTAPPPTNVEPQARAPTPPAFSEAPTPNDNLLPPHEYIPPATAVVPGTLQLHYPPSGNGYVTGSSPQALDDDRTAKVPGVTLHVPLQPDPPPPMPPPQDPLH
jgi:hypothetical protein